MAYEHVDAAEAAIARVKLQDGRAALLLMHMAHKVPPDKLIYSGGWESSAAVMGFDLPAAADPGDTTPGALAAAKVRKAAKTAVERATVRLVTLRLIELVNKPRAGTRAEYKLTLFPPGSVDYKAPVTSIDRRRLGLHTRRANDQQRGARTLTNAEQALIDYHSRYPAASPSGV